MGPAVVRGFLLLMESTELALPRRPYAPAAGSLPDLGPLLARLRSTQPDTQKYVLAKSDALRSNYPVTHSPAGGTPHHLTRTPLWRPAAPPCLLHHRAA